MRKKSPFNILKTAMVMIMVTVACLPFAKAQTIEDGTEAHPFLIESRQELLDFHDCMNTNADFYFNGSTFVTTDCGTGCITIFAGGKLDGNQQAYFKLAADIVVNAGLVATCEGEKDASWDSWTPIKSFKGVFDGDYHTISGIYCKQEAQKVGFFEELSNGIVRNLGIANSYIYGRGYVGGIVGDVISSSVIDHCFYWGAVESAGDYCGGIGGRNFSGSTISNCYTTGNLHTTGQYSGNIVGRNNSGSTLTNCYSSMWSYSDVGLFGGICGQSDGVMSSCYYDQQQTPNTGTVNIGTKMLTREMATASFTSLGSAFIPENGMYPKLTGFNYNDNPAARLSVAPLYLHANSSSDCENMDDIHSDFKVGTTPAGVDWAIDSWNEAAVLVTSDSVHLNCHGIADLTLTISGMTRLWTVEPKIWPYIGSETNPFTIANLDELNQFRDGINSGQRFMYKRMWVYPAQLDTIHWLQIADISLGSVPNYTPCGTASYPFRGFYDGGHYKIDSMKITSSGTCNYKGFFGYARNANIKNLDFYDPDVTGCSYVSILCGRCDNSLVVDSCHIYRGKLKATGSNSYCGAICGDAYGTSTTSSIKHCLVDSVTITGQYAYTGGICGASESGYIRISDCEISRTPINGRDYTGGICGYTYNQSSITNCTVRESAINANSSYVGGICGYMYNSTNTITNCKLQNTPVKGSSYVGGICGYFYCGTISNCSVRDTTITGTSSYVGGICGYMYGGYYIYSYINNCNNYAKSVISSGSYVGGILGSIEYYYSYLNIQSCKNYSYVKGGSYVGGILGRGCTYSSDRNTLSYCYNAGQVVGSSDYTGGIAGYYARANYCINTGVVRGTNYVGGIGGSSVDAYYSMNTADLYCNNYGGGIAYSGTANYCANYGNVIPKNPNVPQITEYGVSSSSSYSYNVGRIFGIENARTSGNNGTQVYYDDDFVGDQYARADGTGLQQSQMLSASGSITGLNSSYWIFEEGRYPRLKWTNDSAWARPIAEAASWPVKLATEPEDANNVLQGVKLYGCNNGVTWRVEEPAAGERGGCIFTDNLESLTCSSNAITPTVDATCQGITVVAAVYGDSVIKRVMLRPFVKAPTDTLTIDNLEELQAFRDSINSGESFHWKGHYVPRFADSTTFLLTDDITMPTSYWTPIGNNYTVFRGVFLGGGHTIDKMVANSSRSGLFCHVNGRVQDLNFTNVNMQYGDYKGAVCAYLCNGKVANITVSGNMYGSYQGGIVGWSNGIDTIQNCVNNCVGTSTGYNYVGGILGHATGTTYISDCENKVNVGGYYVGGIVGICSSLNGVSGKVKVERCTNEGNISGSYMGGIVGSAGTGSQVSDCINKGKISGNYFAGGIVGDGSSLTITNCTNEKDVTGTGTVGGIAGSGSSHTITNCINEGDVVTSGGNVGGISGGSGTATNCVNRGSKVKSTYTNSYSASGIIYSGTANYCHNEADVEGYNVAGILYSGNANHCYNFGNVKGYNSCQYAGGICGSGNAYYCYNVGTVTALAGSSSSSRYAGGITGSGTAQYCYNAGQVFGFNSRYVGGITGNGSPRYCYNSNTVRSSGTYKGSISGYGTPQDCYYDKQMSPMGGVNGSDNAGNHVVGKSTTEMLGSGLSGLLGENATWTFTENYYPQLTEYRNTSPSLSSVMPVLLQNDETALRAFNSFYMKGCDIGEWHIEQGAALRLDTASALHQCEGSVIGYGIIKLGAAVNDTIYRRDRILIGISENAPYIIKNLTEMKNFRDVINKNGFYNMADSTYHLTLSSDDSTHIGDFAEIQDGGMDLYFKLIVDLDMTPETNWEPVGAYADNDNDRNKVFQGTFMGDNHTISNLVLKSSSRHYNGLFGRNNIGEIRDLHITNSKIINTTGNYRGILCGYNLAGVIKNCSVEDSKIEARYSYMGILCGNSEYGTIHNCHVASDTITGYGYSYIGGICGRQYYGVIDTCYNEGLVMTGSNSNAGGICGYSERSLIMDCQLTDSYINTTSSQVGGICGYNGYSCYENASYGIIRCDNLNTEMISSSDYFGGIVGYDYYYGRIQNCNVKGGSITSSSNYVGGIVGYKYYGYSANYNIENCLNENPVTGRQYVGGICGDLYYYNQIRNCTNKGAVTGTDRYTGGIVGRYYYQYTTNGFYGCTNYAPVTGIMSVGGLAGYAYYAQMLSSYNRGHVTATADYVGGLVGEASSFSVDQCYNAGNVTSDGNYVGGLYGTTYSYYSYPQRYSFNTGIVTGKNNVGGLFGTCNTSFQNCYNAGIVKGVSQVGGLMGYLESGYSGNGYSYSIGWVEGASLVGAICGYTQYPGYLTNCYYDTQMCFYGPLANGTHAGSTGKLTREMLGDNLKSGVHGTLNSSYWTFTDGMYPRLTYLKDKDASIASTEPVLLPDDVRADGLPVDNYPNSLGGCDSVEWKRVMGYNYAIDGCSLNTTASDRARIGALIDGDTLKVVQLMIGILNQHAIEITDRIQLKKFRDLVNTGQTFYYDPILREFRESESSYYVEIPPYGQDKEFLLMSDIDLSLESEDWVPIGNYGLSYDPAQIISSATTTVNMNNGTTIVSADNPVRFYDSGGPTGNYGNNENFLHTFISNNGSPITIRFTNVSASCYYDYMTIYNAASANDNSRAWGQGYLCNMSNTWTYTSTPNSYTGGNAITVKFISDGSNVGQGWEAVVYGGYPKFMGTFNGNGHTISGLKITEGTKDYQGLFGYLEGVVKNLKMENTQITAAGNNHGSMVGYNHGTMTDCGSTMGVVKGTNYVGGLVGRNTYDQMEDCYNGNDVTGSQYVGGIAGQCTDAGILYRCFNYGVIKSTYNGNAYVGGITGYSTTQISYCYNTGIISGKQYVGGVIGQNSSSLLQYCYNAGFVDSLSNNYVGSVVGYRSSSYTSGSYDRQMSPIFYGDGLGGSIGYDYNSSPYYTANMSGTNPSVKSRLGVASTWTFSEGMYPRLASMDTLTASYVSTKVVSLPHQQKVNHIVFPFSVATGDGVEWYRYGLGKALNLENVSEGDVQLKVCGDDTLQVMKNGDRRLVPFYVKELAAETLVDTACNGFYIWAANGRVYTYSQHDVTLIPVAEGCDSVLELDITVPPALTLNIISHNHDCYGDDAAYAEAVPNGGFGEGYIDKYFYYWTMDGSSDTISKFYRISDTTAYFGGFMPPGAYHLSIRDKLHPDCEISRDVIITEPDELTASRTGYDYGCYNQADGIIALEVAGGTLPYTISWSGASSGSQTLNATGADTITNLNDGTYNVRVTDNHGCYVDLDPTTLTGDDEEYSVTAMGVDKMYDGVAVNLGRYILQIGSGTPDTIASGTPKTLADGAILTVNVSNTTTQKDYTTGTVNEIASWTLTKGGVDASCRYNVTLHNNPVEIRKRDVVITSATDMKVYDGTALENHTVTISGSGFVAPDDTLSTTVTGSQTLAGTSDNTFTYELTPSTNPANYDIQEVTGTLTVTPEGTLVLVAGSKTKMYDGIELTEPTFIPVGLHAGDTVIATVVGSQLNAGASANVVDTLHYTFEVKGISDGVSHKSAYDSVILKNGSLTVTPRSVILATGSDRKIYDGTSLSRPEITISGDGFVAGEMTVLDTMKITNYGSITNRIDTVRGANFRVENYNITFNPGTLSISKRPLTIIGETRTLAYTGDWQQMTGFFAPNLLTADTITGLTYLAKGKEVNETPGYDGQFTPNDPSSVVIKRKADGVVVTDNYDIVELVPGKLYITGNPRPLVVISNSQSFTYDHQPHSYLSYSVLYNEESMPAINDTVFVLTTGDTLTFRPAGPGRGITHVSESGDNDFTYDLQNSVSYINKDTIKGTISITPRLVNLRSPNYTIVYDGQTKIPDADQDDEDVERSGQEFVPGEGVVCAFDIPAIQRKNVGSSLNVFSYTFKPNTLASDYIIDTTYGVLTVTPVRLVLTAVDTFKYYGEENPPFRYTLTGFVNNEDTAHNAPFVGSARPVLTTTATSSSDAGNYPINIDLTGVSFANYEIEPHAGNLAVRYRTVTITANSTPDIPYDGALHTWEENIDAQGRHFTVAPGQLREGDSVVSASLSGDRTIAGTALIEVSNARIWHFTSPTDSTDVTLNYEPEYVPGTLTITPRDIKLKPYGYEHVFTGFTYNSDSTAAPHFSVAEGTLAQKDTIVTIQINGSRSAVGETPFVIDSLTILIVNKDSVRGDYTNIAPRYNMTAGYHIVLDTATLRITTRSEPWAITMQGICDTIMYDGNGHGVNGFVKDTFMFNGFTYRVTGLTSKVENKSVVGVYPTTVTGDAHVWDSDNNEVTTEFAVTPVAGCLVINKRPLELTAYGLVAEYDGRIHSSNDILWPRCRITGGTSLGATDVIHHIATTGQISLPGTVPVHIIQDSVQIWNNANADVTDNYNITVIDSSITITDRTVPFELFVRAAHDTVEYNSETQSVTGFETLDFVVNDYHFTVDSVVASGASGENVGYYKNSVSITASDHVPHVFDEQNNDVTSQFHVTTKDDTLRIVQKPITITADDSIKMYDGTPLVDHGWNDHAPAPATNDYVASVEFAGSQTLVGSSNNVPSAAVIKRNVTDDDVTANYAITYVNGTLRVTPDTIAITITSVDHEWTFDGLLHKDSTYAVTYGGVAMTADASGKKFGLPTGDTVRITPTAAGVTYFSDNASNNNTFTYTIDHQNQYVADSIHTTFGTLSIAKKDLLITINDTKQYDQSPLRTRFNAAATVLTTDELASGDAFTAGVVKTTSPNVGVYTTTGSTCVVDTAFATTMGIENYNVTVVATQTITRAAGMEVFCPTATDTVKMYDGTALSPVATGSVPNGTTVTIEYKTATSDWSTTVPSITHVDDGPLAVEVRGVNENYDTVYCNYKLRINPRPIELTAASQEFVFDGDAHTYHVAHTTGTYHFVGADTMDFQFDPASEITFVTDTIDNVITGATPTGTTQADDYTFTYLPGKLTMVFGPAVPLTLTARDTAWVFDGITHSFHSYTFSLNHAPEVTVPASANGVYTFPHDIVLTVSFDPNSEITDYSTAGVVNRISGYSIMYGTADVSGAYDVTLENGRLRILPDTITVTAMDSVFFYDGTVKSQPRYTVTGLVGGAAVSASTSGTIQYVSQSPVTNVITAELIAGIPQNYYLKKVNGTLTMQYTEPEPTVAITAKSGSWTYDGTAHVKDSCEVVFNSTTYQVGPDGNVNLAHGDVLHVEVTGSITNQGSVPNVVDTFYITNNGVDVSGAYSVSRLPGTLTVTQLGGVVVNITGHSAVATYDGDEHRATGYDVTSISNPLFTESDIRYIGSATDTVAARTNAGTTEMALANTMFESSNSNFENVTFVVVPGNVSIDEKALTITAADSIFVYDGTEKQQPRYTIEGLVGTDAINIVGTTGRITYVDESPVVNRVDTGSVCTFSSGLRSNYDITLVDGTLTMDFGPKTPITVTASSYTWTYDGTNHTLPTYKVSVNGGVADSVTTSNHTYALANGDTLTVTMSSLSTIRNVSQSTVVNQIANVTLTNHGHNVADNYIVTRADGALNVEACPVVITAADSVFVYDGNSKTQPRYTVTGLVGTDNLTAVTSGSIQFPSQSPQPNTIISHNFMSGSSDNYSVSYVAGELTMSYQSPKPEITITAKSGTWTYDGALHVKDSCEVVFNGTTYQVGPDGNLDLLHGDVLHVNINGSIDTVGSVANVVATDWTIRHGSVDVSAGYTVNTPVNGTLTITKREAVITANSATKEYDGTPLTDNGWNNTAPTNIASTDVVESVTVTGTQTTVGSSNNVPSNAVIKRGTEDVTRNYEITYANGTLEVTANTKAIAVTSANGSWMYDGSTHTKPEFTVTYDGTTVAAIAGTDGLRYKLPTNDTITLSNVFAGITNFSENAANNNTYDVALQNSGNYGTPVSTTYGTLEITQRSVTLTSGSESRLYNGLPLTKPEVTVSGDGFVTGEVSNIRAIGTITNIGTVTNTITFDTIPAYQAVIEQYRLVPAFFYQIKC